MIMQNGYIIALEKTDANFEAVMKKIQNKPDDPNDYQYKLRADTLEWKLVKLPPVEPEPLTDEDALTRYANSITGANDNNLISATETLINNKIKEGT